MASLTLIDLEAYTDPSVPSQTKLMTTSIKLQVTTTLSKAVLEHLPNELLIYIFQFLSPCDLHRSVYNLNLRLNTICYTQKLYLDLGWTKRSFEYFCSNQQPFASQIYSLRLDDSYDRLTIFNLYIHIDLFTNLRKLTIREPLSENLDKILSKLRTLSYISHLNIHSAVIQSLNTTDALFKIRSLKYLTLHSFVPVILHFNNDLIYPLTELEYLEVDGCFTTEFFELIKHIGPNVKRMKVRILYHRDQNLISMNPTLIDQLLSNQWIPVHLRRLEMKLSFLLLTNFHLILRLFPHLTHLTFSVLTDDIDFISPSIWHQFISTNLLEFKQLQFYVATIGLLGNALQNPSSDQIDSFYLYNSKWLLGPVVMDYNPSIIPPALVFYTSPSPVGVGKSSIQLYGETRYITTTDSNGSIDIDKNITDLWVTLTDDQQMATTVDQLSENIKHGSYPKATQITLCSQMRNPPVENNQKFSLIIHDIMKTIPDLSKITSLNFNTHSSLPQIYPSATLARRLLDKLPKLSRLQIPYDYLLCLLRSPIIVLILSKKIKSLNIVFNTNAPMLPDILRILKVFSMNLHYLYFNIRTDIPVDKFYFILPSLFSGTCKKLSLFQLRLWAGARQQPQIFDEQFKLKLKRCLSAQIEYREATFGKMEYGIKDNEILISF